MTDYTVIGILEESMSGYIRTVAAHSPAEAKDIVAANALSSTGSYLYVAAVLLGTPAVEPWSP